MLANTITLTNATPTDHIYDLVSREGMSSIRRDTTLESSLNSALVIKNTVDLGNVAARNRHLIQLSRNYEDAEGVIHPYSVHLVISRAKAVPDADVELLVSEMKDFLIEANSGVDVTDILRGGN